MPRGGGELPRYSVLGEGGGLLPDIRCKAEHLFVPKDDFLSTWWSGRKHHLSPGQQRRQLGIPKKVKSKGYSADNICERFHGR